MALDASKKIKTKFGERVDFKNFIIDSDEGKRFNVTTSTNVFVNGQLLPIEIWLDQGKFENYIREIVGEKYEMGEEVNKHEAYDVVIIGGGPAGLTAGIYCARARLRTVLLEGRTLGGQVATTDRIENYSGFIDVSGTELIKNMENQAKRFGLEIQTFKRVEKIALNGSIKEVYSGNDIYSASAIILAAGLSTTELGLPEEAQLRGKGVSYCAVCDANFFQGKRVAVVGGGDTAIEDAIYLSKIAAQVFVVHRRDELRAAKILQERAFCNEKIAFLWSHTVKGIIGKDVVQGVILNDLKTGNQTKLDLDGLFVAIGSRPYTDFLKDLVTLDEQGYVLVNDKMETSVLGVFAAGDIRVTPLRQVATAVGDGAIAAISAERYLREKMCK
jgi:thioredoxin reductase (NADPH)